MHLYGYILQDEYAARVHDPRTYHSICRDIITRWVYPIVPEAQLLIDGSYSHLRRYVYREKGVRVARTAHIGEGVVIGQDTIIEEHARVERSVIGRGCIIRAGAVITESHLWKGTETQMSESIQPYCFHFQNFLQYFFAPLMLFFSMMPFCFCGSVFIGFYRLL